MTLAQEILHLLVRHICEFIGGRWKTLHELGEPGKPGICKLRGSSDAIRTFLHLLVNLSWGDNGFHKRSFLIHKV